MMCLPRADRLASASLSVICPGVELPADRIVTGISGRSPNAAACSALSGSALKYSAIPRKAWGWHQCACTLGQTSDGIFWTSPTSRESVDSARPLVSLATSLGIRRPPPVSSAKLARTTPKRASKAPRRDSRMPQRRIRKRSPETCSHSTAGNGSINTRPAT